MGAAASRLPSATLPLGLGAAGLLPFVALSPQGARYLDALAPKSTATGAPPLSDARRVELQLTYGAGACGCVGL